MPTPMIPRFTVGINKRNGRRPCTEPVPFDMILPLALKNSVSGKADSASDTVCLQEMAMMFACMKRHDFSEALCAKEITTFQNCFTEYDKRRKMKLDATEGDYGSKARLHFQQLNKLLAKFPQPK